MEEEEKEVAYRFPNCPPAMSSLQPVTPPALDCVVKTCMAKEAVERWQTAGGLCRELKWIVEGGSQITSMVTAAGNVKRLNTVRPGGCAIRRTFAVHEARNPDIT
jgi:hypothetical protein